MASQSALTCQECRLWAGSGGCGTRGHPASCHVVYTATCSLVTLLRHQAILGSWDTLGFHSWDMRSVPVPFHRCSWSSFHVTGVWFPSVISPATNRYWPHPLTGQNHVGKYIYRSLRVLMGVFILKCLSHYLKAIRLAPKRGRPYNQLAVIAINAVSARLCFDGGVFCVLFM